MSAEPTIDPESGILVRVVGNEVRFLLPSWRALYIIPTSAVLLAQQLVAETSTPPKAD
jgi:hypothetical protein